MATKLELTVNKLLKDKDNFISERGVEKKLKNGKTGKTELLMSIKGLKQEKKIEEKVSKKNKAKEEIIVEEKPTEEE